MDPLHRGISSHPLLPSQVDPHAAPELAPLRIQHERWLVRTAERTGQGAALEQALSAALSEGGAGSKVVLEAKAVAGRAVKLGAAGKVEVERTGHGYRVLVLGGLAVKAGAHGHGWKAELEQGLSTGKAWHFETREGAAWASSVLLQGLASDTPAALLLPGDPGLDARLGGLELHAGAAILEWESEAKAEASTEAGGAVAEAVFTGEGRVELDRDTGELVMEQELKVAGAAGGRAFKLGEFLEVGARLDVSNLQVKAAWVQRWRLSDAERERAARGDLLQIARGLSPAAAQCEVKVTLSGQVGGRGFEAIALEAAQSPGEAERLATSGALDKLPVKFAELVPPHGVVLGVDLGPVEVELEAKVEPRIAHVGEARPLGEWLSRLNSGARELHAAQLKQSVAALAHRE